MKKLLLSLLIPVFCMNSSIQANDLKVKTGALAGLASILSMKSAVDVYKQGRNNPPPQIDFLFAVPLVLGSISSGILSGILLTDPSFPLKGWPGTMAKLMTGGTAGTIAAISAPIAIACGVSLAKKSSPSSKSSKTAALAGTVGCGLTAISAGILSYLAFNSVLDIKINFKYTL